LFFGVAAERQRCFESLEIEKNNFSVAIKNGNDSFEKVVANDDPLILRLAT